MNAAIAMQFLGMWGQLVLLTIVFVSLAAGASALSVDVYSRSSQVVSNLRSIGASRTSVSSALAVSMLGSGAGGAAIGGVAGVLLGAALAGAGMVGGTLLVQLVAVVFAASAGIAVGTFSGGRASWRS